MTDNRKTTTLPNGFRLVIQENADSVISEMVKTGAKKRKTQIRNARRRKRKQAEAKAQAKVNALAKKQATLTGE